MASDIVALRNGQWVTLQEKPFCQVRLGPYGGVIVRYDREDEGRTVTNTIELFRLLVEMSTAHFTDDNNRGL